MKNRTKIMGMPPRLLSHFILLSLLPLLSACYQVAPDASQNIAPTQVHIPNVRLANTVLVDGSAIVAVLLKNEVKGFASFTPGYNVEIGNAGTNDGFTLFCEDKTDIQMAVRAMSGDEAAACLRNGLDYLQLTVAYDVLAVIGDAPLNGCISATELTFLYTHDTTKLNWSNVRSGLPSVPIKIFAPSGQTAAAQFFAEQMLQGKQSLVVPDIQGLITGGSGIGYLSFVEARKLNGRLPILAVDSGTGCTMPSEQTVWDGSYALLSRPLYLYINRQSARRSEVFRFLSYALSVTGQSRIGNVGFLGAPPKTYEDAQTELDHANQSKS